MSCPIAERDFRPRRNRATRKRFWGIGKPALLRILPLTSIVDGPRSPRYRHRYSRPERPYTGMTYMASPKIPRSRTEREPAAVRPVTHQVEPPCRTSAESDTALLPRAQAVCNE